MSTDPAPDRLGPILHPVPDPEDQDPAELEPDQRDRLAGSVLQGAAILDIPLPASLVRGWLWQDTLAALYGPPKSGKSLAALDFALSVATGRKWQGNTVERGPVLYVAAEGAAGLGKRARAWCQHNGYGLEDALGSVTWITRAVNLYTGDDLDDLCRLVDQVRPVLVVVDTLARCSAGAEENSARDMGKVVENLDRVRRVAGSCVLVVHHTGKDSARGMRGSTALLGAVDVAVEARGDGEGPLRLSVAAVKDAAAPPPEWFRMVPVEGTDSVVLAGTHPGGTGGEVVGPTLAALLAVQIPGGVSSGTWKAQAMSEGIAEATFYRHRADLVESGKVRNLGTGSRPLYVAADPEPEPPDTLDF